MSLGVSETTVTYQVDANNNAVPQGYKQTDVGIIPNDWLCTDIGALNPFVTSGSRGWAAFYSEYGQPFVRITNTKRHSIYLDLSDLKFVNLPETSSEGKRTSLLNGDVLISITADIGISSYVDDSLAKPAYINQHIALVRFDLDENNSKFVTYFLSSENVQKLFRSTSDQGAKAGLNLDSVKKIKLALPSQTEQTAIANALSDVDALIQELEKLIAKKLAIKIATMQQLLTGRTRLPQFAHHPDGRKKGYKPSELGEIPEDWYISNVKQVSLVPMQNGLFYQPLRKGKGVPLINVSDMYKTAPIDVQGLELFDATPAEIKVFKVSYGDLFFTRSSVVPSGIAYCNIFHSERNDVVFDSHLIRVRPNTDLVDPNYLYLNCTSKHARNALIAEAKTATMTTIDQGAINRCPVLIPTKSEQSAIANMLSDMDLEIQALDQRLNKTREIKQGMMQELLTGKTRLVQPLNKESQHGCPTAKL